MLKRNEFVEVSSTRNSCLFDAIPGSYQPWMPVWWSPGFTRWAREPKRAFFEGLGLQKTPPVLNEKTSRDEKIVQIGSRSAKFWAVRRKNTTSSKNRFIQKQHYRPQRVHLTELFHKNFSSKTHSSQRVQGATAGLFRSVSLLNVARRPREGFLPSNSRRFAKQSGSRVQGCLGERGFWEEVFWVEDERAIACNLGQPLSLLRPKSLRPRRSAEVQNVVRANIFKFFSAHIFSGHNFSGEKRGGWGPGGRGAQERGGPELRKRLGARRLGAPKGEVEGGPTFLAFFPLSRSKFRCVFLSLGISSWNCGRGSRPCASGLLRSFCASPGGLQTSGVSQPQGTQTRIVGGPRP